jgi:Ca2+-binding RTX toxin-like protein
MCSSTNEQNWTMTRFLKAVTKSLNGRAILLATVALAATSAAALAANITGTNGNDTLIGTSGNDNINGLQGNDIIFGLGGSDSINDGNGNDVIDGGGKCMPGSQNAQYCSHGQVKPCGQDNFNVGNGNDAIYGNCGPNNINVGSGNDTIYGGPVGDNINLNGHNSGTDFIFLGVGGGNNVSTSQGTTIVYAQNGHKDNIACHGNTTVYADKIDQTSNCTKVIYTPAGASDLHGRTAPKQRAHEPHVFARRGM